MVIISFKHHIFRDYAVEKYFVMNKGNNCGLLLINWTEPLRQYYMIFSLNKQISHDIILRFRQIDDINVY